MSTPAGTQTDTQPHKMSKERKRLLTNMASLFAAIAVLWFLHWLLWGQFDIETDDAYVNGNLVQIMPQVPGTIVSINTDDTHLATEGQLLVKLDEADMQVALQRARANLATTVRQVRQYYEDVQQAQAAVVLRQADLEKAQLDMKRRTDLIGERAISREELQHYTTAVTVTQAQYDSAMHKLTSAISLVENSRLYQHPIVERAKANFKTAYLNWVRTTIYSPITGYVARRNAQVGQQVDARSALMAVIPLNEIWIDANYKENQLARIRIGQKVEAVADINGFTYHGKVVGLGAGTGSAFALLPPQNATGNWIKIVQRLPVRIALDPQELKKHPLQLGLSMRVTIYTRWLRGTVLSEMKDEKPVYSTNIFNDQLAHADQEIDTLLRDNAPDIELKGLQTPRQEAKRA